MSKIVKLQEFEKLNRRNRRNSTKVYKKNSCARFVRTYNDVIAVNIARVLCMRHYAHNIENAAAKNTRHIEKSFK